MIPSSATSNKIVHFYAWLISADAGHYEIYKQNQSTEWNVYKVTHKRLVMLQTIVLCFKCNVNYSDNDDILYLRMT